MNGEYKNSERYVPDIISIYKNGNNIENLNFSLLISKCFVLINDKQDHTSENTTFCLSPLARLYPLNGSCDEVAIVCIDHLCFSLISYLVIVNESLVDIDYHYIFVLNRPIRSLSNLLANSLFHSFLRDLALSSTISDIS
jgi:hypothetical protein